MTGTKENQPEGINSVIRVNHKKSCVLSHGKFPRGFRMNERRPDFLAGSLGGIHRRFQRITRFDETGGTMSTVINLKLRGLCTTIGLRRCWGAFN